jgi:hypothetical protein
LKQLDPARTAVAVAAVIVMAGAVSLFGVADAQSRPTGSSSPIAVVSSPSSESDMPFRAAGTVYLALPTPTPAPSLATLAPTPKPTPKPYRDTVTNARLYVKNRIGPAQYNCIDYIFTRESGWNPRAANPSGAYGIPQAKPGSKMATFGSNWRYSPLTQVKWGIWYVNSRYGSACQALTFFKSHGWY